MSFSILKVPCWVSYWWKSTLYLETSEIIIVDGLLEGPTRTAMLGLSHASYSRRKLTECALGPVTCYCNVTTRWCPVIIVYPLGNASGWHQSVGGNCPWKLDVKLDDQATYKAAFMTIRSSYSGGFEWHGQGYEKLSDFALRNSCNWARPHPGQGEDHCPNYPWGNGGREDSRSCAHNPSPGSSGHYPKTQECPFPPSLKANFCWTTSAWPINVGDVSSSGPFL